MNRWRRCGSPLFLVPRCHRQQQAALVDGDNLLLFREQVILGRRHCHCFFWSRSSSSSSSRSSIVGGGGRTVVRIIILLLLLLTKNSSKGSRCLQLILRRQFCSLIIIILIVVVIVVTIVVIFIVVVIIILQLRHGNGRRVLDGGEAKVPHGPLVRRDRRGQIGSRLDGAPRGGRLAERTAAIAAVIATISIPAAAIACGLLQRALDARLAVGVDARAERDRVGKRAQADGARDGLAQVFKLAAQHGADRPRRQQRLVV